MKGVSSKVFLNRLAQHYGTEKCHLSHDPARPWTLLFAVILSAQCTDKRVNQVTPILFKSFSDLEAFAVRPVEEIQQVIRSTGFYRNKAKSLQGAARMLLLDFGGKLPNEMEDLVELPGVGRKTANVILWNIYHKNQGVVVDTHVSRITQRLGLTIQKTPEKIEQALMKLLPKKSWGPVSHQLIQFGRDTCKAPTPKCSACFFADICPRRGVKKSV